MPEAKNAVAIPEGAQVSWTDWMGKKRFGTVIGCARSPHGAWLVYSVKTDTKVIEVHPDRLRLIAADDTSTK